MFSRHYRSIDWGRIARRVASEVWNDDVFGRAGQLAYFWLFSLIPTLLIVAVILGYLAQGAAMRENLMGLLSRAIPDASFQLVRDAIWQMTSHAGAGKLSIGIVTTVWAASSGMSSVIDGLNKAYEVSEARPWWKSRVLAAVLTIALAALIVTALVILLYGAHVGTFLGDRFGLGNVPAAWNFVEWPAVFAFVVTGSLMVYRFAPNLHDQKLWSIAPGAVVSAVMWIVVSLLLRVYLRFFHSYSTVYGSLGAVLVLLLWIYLCSAALLIGGELNSEIENAAAEHGDANAKLPGEKAPGARL